MSDEHLVDATLLFLQCPMCPSDSMFKSGLRGMEPRSIDDFETRCPNGHYVVYRTEDLFYRNGARLRRPRSGGRSA